MAKETIIGKILEACHGKTSLNKEITESLMIFKGFLVFPFSHFIFSVYSCWHPQKSTKPATSLCVCACMYVFMCVRETQRDRERDTEGSRETERLFVSLHDHVTRMYVLKCRDAYIISRIGHF